MENVGRRKHAKLTGKVDEKSISAPFSSVYGLLVAIGQVDKPILAPLAETGRPIVERVESQAAGVGVP